MYNRDLEEGLNNLLTFLVVFGGPQIDLIAKPVLQVKTQIDNLRDFILLFLAKNKSKRK